MMALHLVGGLLTAAAVPAPFINTWLVSGTFDNGPENAGFDREWIDETGVDPGTPAGSGWRWFDDRLFSRNYDDYQDLFSYFRIVRGESVEARVVYAQTWLHCVGSAEGQLRVGADESIKAWLNGKRILDGSAPGCYRDMETADIRLESGWNLLRLKIANRQTGRFGFYARVCDTAGRALPGVTVSPMGRDGELRVSTPFELPGAWVEWPYVAADPTTVETHEVRAFLARKPRLALHASPFCLAAQGGTPPYTWELAEGRLPAGLALGPDGAINGTPTDEGCIGAHTVTVRVTDQEGAAATKTLRLPVRERPSLWYQNAGLVALIHNPESMLSASRDDLAAFARRMRLQGYAIGMMISYNNGDMKYRWPSLFEPDNPLGDLAGMYREALEAEGIRFGMYMGNLIGPNHGGEHGAMLMVEEAVTRYRPAALWFDWASSNLDGYVQLDALYSMIRTLSPDTLIVLNGVQTLYQGDWDVVCLEGWGAWGENMWGLWPFAIDWPKAPVIESWRMVADPTFEYSKDIQPDWQEYMRVAISMIAEGFVANLDHSPTIRQPYRTLDESLVMQVHRSMADWANPPDGLALHESYTQVVPGPLADVPWGYNTMNLDRTRIYLHVMSNARGKTGAPGEGRLTVGPLRQRAVGVLWMNRGKALTFEQEGGNLAIDIGPVEMDPVDTVLLVQLSEPHPVGTAPRPTRPDPVPPGNLAHRKAARLLSTDGRRELVPSAMAFARYGVDGSPSTRAQGAYEWAWTYEVDLNDTHSVRTVVIHFPPGSYATDYLVLLSADGEAWNVVAEESGAKGGRMEHRFGAVPTRFVRIQAVKPDGPGQEGTQMAISQLEVYE